LLMNGLGVKKLATTGYAATLIDGQTIHSYFTINHLLKCSLQYDSSNWHSIKQTNVIIIDECSLMSDELLNLIDEILNRINYDSNTNKSIVPSKFGKKSVILVGDLLQLSAVSTFYKPITQLYKSLLFKNNFVPFILKTNMRALTINFIAHSYPNAESEIMIFHIYYLEFAEKGIHSLMNVKICSIL